MDNVSTLFTMFMAWIGAVATQIASDPLLLIPVGITVVSAAIGMAKGLIDPTKSKFYTIPYIL